MSSLLRTPFLSCLVLIGLQAPIFAQVAVTPSTPEAGKATKAHAPKADTYALTNVRLLPGPFADAVSANRDYLLALEPDRLLAPFRREAGLKPRAESYGDWENTGLDGHTGGHYLAALADMIAAGADEDGALQKRLDYILTELQECQRASGDGYLGGVPGSKALWADIRGGKIEASGFGLNNKWVPWYNVHKTFAGLRDVWFQTSNPRAKELLVGLSDWCVNLVGGLSDAQMQDMLRSEHGGMNEVLADVYSITGDSRYLQVARRFVHHAVLDPLMAHEDKLTGLHANTQIPKVIGLHRIGMLDDDEKARSGAEYFWHNVVEHRTVAFGGNSVSEHFNDVRSFRGMIEHREGPETCNSYNMLRLTEALFREQPKAGYLDYYERTLYNHILASINPKHPGYVYFTPIRPGHYRVYSNPQDHFWCCVGSGMENPGRYGALIYARAPDGVFVNLFVPSVLSDERLGLELRQETRFPEETGTQLSLKLKQPSRFTLHLRRPGWAGEGFAVEVNGAPVEVTAAAGDFLEIKREWKDGDVITLKLPLQTVAEQLPDKSGWVAFLRGPVLLAAPLGSEGVPSYRGEKRRGGHVASGTLIPLDQLPVLLAKPEQAASHLFSGKDGTFALREIVYPESKDGTALIPFYRLHESRYQMYWETTTREGLEERQRVLALAEKARAARDAATLDRVAIGEQQPESDHAYKGEGSESGEFQGRRWRHGRMFQYTLDLRGAPEAELSVTYSGMDRDRTFDISINGKHLATEALKGERPGEFVEKRYAIPGSFIADADAGKLTVRFTGQGKSLAGGIFDLRLVRPGTPLESP